MNPNLTRIALIGDYNPTVPAHQAIPRALQLAAEKSAIPLDFTWLETTTLSHQNIPEFLTPFHAIWCVPASPYHNTAAALAAIQFARTTHRPFLGTCGGFQHALLEFAHNVLNLPQADHAETAPEAPLQLISRLACSLVEKSQTLTLTPDSQLQKIYHANEATEPYRCNFGLNPAHESLLQNSALKISARDSANEVRAVELSTHPFFLATLFQPERAALQNQNHPVIDAFVRAAAQRAK